MCWWKIFYRLEAKGDSFSFDFEATYDEVNAPNKMPYLLTDGRQVDITFKKKGSENQVIITFDA